MPPPPPPSKSYLLRFDTDSEDEDEVEEKEDEKEEAMKDGLFDHIQKIEGRSSSENHFRSILGLPKINVAPSLDSKDRESIIKEPQSLACPSTEPTDDVVADASPIDQPELQSEEGNHGINTDIDIGIHIGIHNEDDNEDDNDDETSSKPATNKKNRRKRKKKRKKKKGTLTQTKNVTFGTVQTRLQQRILSECGGVPSDGGWPIGLSDTVILDTDPCPIDQHVLQRQQNLQARWTLLYPTHPPPNLLETRQFDYCRDKDEMGRSIRNPLFMPLDEDQRRDLLCKGHQTYKPKHNKPSTHKKSHRNGDSRTLSNNSLQSASTETQYTSTQVLHVRNQLEHLRAERSNDQGCNCRKTVIFLPAHNAGKKSHQRRMNERKLKEELRKRHLLPREKKTREQLEQLLHDALENEPCCTVDCSCATNGVNCQADTCSCWHESHHTQTRTNKKDFQHNKNSISINSIKQRCGNKMYVVDMQNINKYRKDIICHYIHQTNQQ